MSEVTLAWLYAKGVNQDSESAINTGEVKYLKDSDKAQKLTGVIRHE